MEFEISASNLCKLLALARALHRGGMGYSAGSVDRCNENPPMGTVLSVTDRHLVACFMEPCDRLIVHACVPCKRLNADRQGLFAMDAPRDFHLYLARYKDEPITVELRDNHAELHLPAPRGLKRNVTLPLKSVGGTMLSQVHPAGALCSLIINHKDLSTALNAMPRDGERLAATDCMFTFVAGREGLAFWSGNQHVETHIHMECTPIGSTDLDVQHTCSARRCRDFRRILKVMRGGDQHMVIQVSPERITLFNDWVTAQFFTVAGEHNNTKRPIPLTVPEVDDLVLDLDPGSATLTRDSGKWIRSLVNSVTESRKNPSTSWHLTQRGVTVSVSAGVETSVEIAAVCGRWPLPEKDLRTDVHPLATADMLNLLLGATTPVQLIVRSDRLMMQSTKQGIEMIQAPNCSSSSMSYGE